MPASHDDPMIRTVDVRVDYDAVTAVQDMNLAIAAGEVFGLIGPNGAGKTSTIRVLATLLEPTYGEVYIGGIDAAEDPAAAHELIGYMPDLAPVYDDLTVWEFLDLFARAYGLDRRQRRVKVDECIGLVNLESKRHAMGAGLSRGMKQRLVLAKTLLHDPKVLLLDEPASGLDPIARIDLRNTLRRLGGEGRTVFISSHILTELSDFCTAVGIMEKGRVVLSGRIDDIIAQLAPHRRVVVELIGPVDGLADSLTQWEHVLAVEGVDGRIEIDFSGDHDASADLLARLVGQGVRVRAFYERRMDMEDILLKIGAKEVS